MSYGCQPAARARCRTFADMATGCTAVLAADVLDPNQDLLDRWTVEISLRPPHDELPTRVCGMLVDHDMAIRRAGPKGPTYRALVVPA